MICKEVKQDPFQVFHPVILVRLARIIWCRHSIYTKPKFNLQKHIIIIKQQQEKYLCIKLPQEIVCSTPFMRAIAVKQVIHEAITNRSSTCLLMS